MTRQSLLSRLKLMLNGPARAEPAPAADPAPPAADPAPAPPAFAYEDSRIPSASQQRIEKIQQLLVQIEAQARQTDDGQDALAEARRIQNNYLPDLMNSYFDIPSAHRAEIFRRTGKSASFQLNERLDTMIEELQRISAGFAAGQIDSFSVNLRFIDKRFREPGDNDPFA